jgi:alanine-synthesizing transaminase
VPGIALRGISKEFPWPGSRCGWAEFYNADKDTAFARYIKTIQDAKMMEVCATTLPQKVLPKIMSDDRYYPYLAERTARYRDKAKIACDIFSKVPGLMINMPKGAFYLTVVFEKGALKEGQRLEPQNGEAAKIISPLLNTDKLDKQFVYHLLASRGICVVPLSTGFNSDLYGFRMTVLEADTGKFRTIVEEIARAAEEYIKSV